MKQGSKGAGESGGRRRLQSALIVAQVAVSVVLLVGAGLLLASFYRLQSVDPGYQGDRVMSAELFTNFSKYPNVDTQLRFYLPLIERLESQPGVVSVAVTNAVPLRVVAAGRRPRSRSRGASSTIRTAGRPPTRASSAPASSRRSACRSCRDGRSRRRTGREAQRVVVINKRDDALLGRVRSDRLAHLARQRADVVTIVGIVGDVKQFGLDQPAVAQVYTPLRQTAAGLGGLVLVRTTGDAGVGDGADSRRGLGDRSQHAGAERPHARRDPRDAIWRRRS